MLLDPLHEETKASFSLQHETTHSLDKSSNTFGPLASRRKNKKTFARFQSNELFTSDECDTRGPSVRDATVPNKSMHENSFSAPRVPSKARVPLKKIKIE